MGKRGQRRSPLGRETLILRLKSQLVGVCTLRASELVSFRVLPASDADKVSHKAGNLTLDQSIISQNDVFFLNSGSVALVHS